MEGINKKVDHSLLFVPPLGVGMEINMKIAITGATGFIGKNMLSSLDYKNNDYICLVREQSNCKDLEEFSYIRIKSIKFDYNGLLEALNGVDILIHMIGQMGEYGVPDKVFEEVNCILTADVVNASIQNHVKQLIYLSTPGVQGFGKRLCVEEEPYAPRNIYERTKVQAEKIIIDLLQNTSVKYTILRPDFVYGPGDYRRIKMYKKIRDKNFILTTSGKSYLHPTYVMDVVQGINCAVDNPNAYNQIFNISAENDITVQDYLKTMADYFNVSLIKINIGYSLSVFAAIIIEKICNVILKRDAFVSKNKIDFLAMDHSTSIEKAKRLLGYKPQYDFKHGFNKTMEWCKEQNAM